MRIQLSGGTFVTATEVDFPGMAGETMTVLHFIKDDGSLVNSADVKSMAPDQAVGVILEWEKDLSESNRASAISFCM